VYHRNKNIRSALLASLLCFAFFIKGQNKTMHDTILLQHYFDVGTKHAQTDHDSAFYYADQILNISGKKNYPFYAAEAYYLKAKICYFISDYEKAQSYQRKAIILCQPTGNLNLLGKLYNLSGALLYSMGDYENSLKQYLNRLNVNILQKDTSGMLQAYYNVSLVYNMKAQYRKTVEVNYKALELAEKTKDSINLMALYEGLGMAYYQLEDSGKALYFLREAFKLSMLKKDEFNQGGILIDFGNVYQLGNDHSKAIRYYDEAISLTKKNGDRRRLGTAISNKATSLVQMKDYQNALINLDEAIRIQKEINNQKGLSDALSVKSETYFALKNYPEAIRYAKASAGIATKIEARKEEYITYRLLSKVYEAMGDNANAFYYYKRFVNLRDSIDNKKEIRAVSGIEFNFEKEKIERRQKHEQEIADKQLHKQKVIRNIILSAGIIMLGLFFFILRNYSEKQKANVEIKKQHEIIDQQNKDILQSINYSRKIQEAILAPAENIKALLPDSFVLYKPKDIVSGDFYFIESVFPGTSKDNWVSVALADSTGHGVPGALMSLTGYNILKQTLNNKEVNDPGEALDFLNLELHHFLKQNQKEQRIRDGMDISFCAINFNRGELLFAGANNPIWIVSKTENKKDLSGNPLQQVASKGDHFVYEVKANKQHIGYNEKTEKFINHKISVEKGDMIYLFTDGYADQFGGKDGKKFMYKRFRETLIEMRSSSMNEQKNTLETIFENWKGTLDQVDDVSIIGIRI
jgi:serine phosphatase RsbU (regulator of sigma subunit)